METLGRDDAVGPLAGRRGPAMHPFLDLLARPLRWLFQWLLALIVLFEEWGWEPLARLMAQLAQLPLIGWLERRIARLPPALALGVSLGAALLPALGAYRSDVLQLLQSR